MDPAINALTLLQQDLPLYKVKEAKGILRGSIEALGGASKALAEPFTARGMPVAATVGRLLPYAAAAYGAHRVWQSEPVQRMRARYQQWKYERAMKNAMRGGQ